MAYKYILDAHAVIWYLEGNPKLSATAQAIMDDPVAEMVLPMIAFAEAIHTVAKGKTRIPGVSALMADVTGNPQIELYPLTFEILQQSLTATTVPEMHDRLITATALYLEILGHQVAVVTKDEQIIASGLVRIVW